MNKKINAMTCNKISGLALRLHVDGDVVLHLRHRWHAAVWQLGPHPQHVHREAQQLQTYLPIPHAPLQVNTTAAIFNVPPPTTLFIYPRSFLIVRTADVTWTIFNSVQI